MNSRAHGDYRWSVLGVLALLMEAATSPPAAAQTDVELEARRILAPGYELPAGFTSLVATRKTVIMSVRGRTRERRQIAISGTFERNGTTISFETIRGQRIRLRGRHIAEEYRGDDDWFRYEAVARIMLRS
jgi:hypothetical protein